MEHAGQPDHHHDHDHHSDVPSDVALRVKALESLLIEKGLVDPAALDAIIETYEHKVGPHNGARVVARAWADPAYRQRLLEDGTAAIAELGYAGPQGSIIVVENSDSVHNLIVCTLCSCYPYPVLGLPPVWYKSAAYRSRAVIDPRGVPARAGSRNPGGYRSPRVGFQCRGALHGAAEAPGRHGEHGRGRARGAGQPRCDDRRRTCTSCGCPAMNSIHDMGGMHGLGPILYRARRAGIPCALGSPCGRADRADGSLGTLDLGCVPVSDRTHAGRRVPALKLLRKMVDRADRPFARGRPDQQNGTREWPARSGCCETNAGPHTGAGESQPDQEPLVESA